MDRLEIVTPEGLALEMTLAGIGSRAVAAILDALIIAGASIGYFFLISITGFGGPVAGVIAIVLWNLAVLAYFPLFEGLNSGQTPGKRRANIQVVRADGGPATFLPVIIRNLVRIIDFLPFLYGVGLVVMFASRNNQRLGDLAAGTVVLKRAPKHEPLPDLPVRRRPEPSGAASGMVGWDVTAVTKDEVAIIRRFLSRRSTLAPGPRAALTERLVTQISPKVIAPPDTPHGEGFLEMVAHLKTSDG